MHVCTHPHLYLRTLFSSQVWWMCDRDKTHVFEATVSNRYYNNLQCPQCAKLKTTLAVVNPVLSAQWHPTLNGELTPDNVTRRSTTKAWWVCDKDNTHVFQASVIYRHYQPDTVHCPHCREEKKRRDKERDDLKTAEQNRTDKTSRTSKHNRNNTHTHALDDLDPNLSLLYTLPHVAKQWHPTLNGPLTPSHVQVSSKQKVWWVCPRDDDHVYEASVALQCRHHHRKTHRDTNGSGEDDLSDVLCPLCHLS